MTYRQEYYEGEAEDRAAIVGARRAGRGPLRSTSQPVLMTKDTNPLEPKVNEFKFYARGVGPVLAIAVSGGSDREELSATGPASLSFSTSAAASRFIRERGTTRSKPPPSARLRVSWSTCE